MTWGISTWTGTIPLDRKIPTPAPTAGGAAATLSFQKGVTTSGGATSRTLSFTPIASAAGQERLVALVSITSQYVTTTYSSVQIDGQATTQVGPYVRVSDGISSNGPIVSFWRAPGTASTSINVTFNIATGAVFDARGALWTLGNAGTLFDLTVATITKPVTVDLHLDVATIASGAAAAVILAYSSSTKSTTWSGLTERYDGTADSLYGIDWFSVADLDVASTSTPLTITADLPNDFDNSAPATSGVAGLAVSFTPSGASYDNPSTTAWIAAVGSGNVSGPRKALIDALIVGLKADGIWTKLDRLWIFRAENATCALTDLKGLAVATAVNSPTFTPDRGYTGNGSTSYINTNFNPVANGVNFTQNTACWGLWQINTAGSGLVIHGINLFGHFSEVYLNYAGSSYWRINTSGAQLSAAYPGPGFHIANRSAASAQELYFNGSSITSNTVTATAALNTKFYILARNNDGGTPTAGDFNTDQISVVVMGGTLTATEHGNLYTRLNTYVTATP